MIRLADFTRELHMTTDANAITTLDDIPRLHARERGAKTALVFEGRKTTFAQFERRLISQRTKEALAVKKASGVRLGRPPTVPEVVVRRIRRQRERGDTFRKIAADLNEAGVPTAQGGAQWYAATVRHVLLRTA